MLGFLQIFLFVVDGPAICKLPLAFGSGDANLKRWYFDQNTQNCIPFSYGGMHGNQNNFLTQQQCQQICPGDFCQ